MSNNLSSTFNSLRKKKSFKVTAIILAVILLLAGAGVITVYSVLGRINHVSAEDDSTYIATEDEIEEVAEEIPAGYEVLEEYEIDKADEVTMMSDRNVTNVLLIGSDTRKNGSGGGRSDTMIIFSIDKKNGKIKMVSLLRDLYVPIKGRKDNRLNASYAYGGTSLLIDTIESNFKIKIDKYVRVNFSDFVKVVNRIGGVTVNLSEAEAEVVKAHSGPCRLDGTQALRYARIRKLDSDFGRTNRQRTVIKAMISEMKKLSITELSSLMYDIMPYITTDYSSTELLALISQANTLKSYPISEMHIPESGKYKGIYIRGMAVLVTNLNQAARDMQAFLYE